MPEITGTVVFYASALMENKELVVKQNVCIKIDMSNYRLQF